MLGDNESVVTNYSVPSKTLKKKHNDITYNWAREAVAGGVIKLAHIPGKYNPADLLTKSFDPQQYYPLTKEFTVKSVSDLKWVSES